MPMHRQASGATFNPLLTERRHDFRQWQTRFALAAWAAMGEDAPAPSRSPARPAPLLGQPNEDWKTLYLGLDQPTCWRPSSGMGWEWWIFYAGLTFGGIALVLFLQRR